MSDRDLAEHTMSHLEGKQIILVRNHLAVILTSAFDQLCELATSVDVP